MGPAPSPPRRGPREVFPGSGRLTRLAVDLDVEVALRPVLRPHRYRGDGKSCETERERKAVRAGAEPEPRAPRAGLSRQGRLEGRRPLAPRASRARIHAGELFTWLASSLLSSPRAQRRRRGPRGRSPTPLTAHPTPFPAAQPPAATPNPARAGANPARAQVSPRGLNRKEAPGGVSGSSPRRSAQPRAPSEPRARPLSAPPLPSGPPKSVAQSGSPGRRRLCALPSVVAPGP